MVYKAKLLPHHFFSCLNIFSVFFWRKTDMFRLWERKFSWYLFPQQSLAAFRTQVPIVKPLILQRTGLQRPCYLIGLKKQGDVALKGQLPCHTINRLHICWIILRRQEGFCCSWLLPGCKSILFETSWGTTGYTTSCSKKWPYRVIELAADKLLWLKVQYFYQRNSCNIASTEASQS